MDVRHENIKHVGKTPFYSGPQNILGYITPMPWETAEINKAAPNWEAFAQQNKALLKWKISCQVILSVWHLTEGLNQIHMELTNLNDNQKNNEPQNRQRIQTATSLKNEDLQVWTIAWYKAQDLRLGRFKPTASQPGKRFRPQGSREMMQKERCVCTARRETNWDKYATIPQKLMEFPYDLMCPFLRTCFTECHWSLK